MVSRTVTHSGDRPRTDDDGDIRSAAAPKFCPDDSANAGGYVQSALRASGRSGCPLPPKTLTSDKHGYRSCRTQLKIKNDTTEWNIALRRATANKARVDDRTGLRTAVERDVDA